MAIKEVRIPDLGGADEVEVIEVSVAPGDAVQEDDALITLESDKASMEVPAPFAGVVKDIAVSVGDKVQEEGLVLTLEVEAAAPEAATASVLEVPIPDLGGADEVEVIEVTVASGDQVNEEDALVTLESDKASMEVPSPFKGTIQEVKLAVGDRVKEGQVVLTMLAVSGGAPAVTAAAPAKSAAPSTKAPAPKAAVMSDKVANLVREAQASAVNPSVHASPSVRRIASEFGVVLTRVNASGPKGRITKEDVQQFIREQLAGGGVPSNGLLAGLEPIGEVDFSKFGEVEREDFNKIKKLTGKFLARNWVTIPHVTQFDEVDITEMEAFRKANKAKAEAEGFKLTPLVFLMKAVVSGLKAFPSFNASLVPGGEALILKKYFHVGIAVDTPNGLVVPVVRDVDQKGLLQLAKELGELSVKARDGKLLPRDMQGGSMSISSLGGIGGTAFTPIVNAPEVAILGVSRSQMKPVFKESEFVPRLMLPLSLSYDHRVIDGAAGARFITHINKVLVEMQEMNL